MAHEDGALNAQGKVSCRLVETRLELLLIWTIGLQNIPTKTPNSWQTFAWAVSVS